MTRVLVEESAERDGLGLGDHELDQSGRVEIDGQLEALFGAHLREDLARQRNAFLRLDRPQIRQALPVAAREPALRLELIEPALEYEGSKDRDGAPAIGDLERLAPLDGTEVLARLLSQLPYPDRLHMLPIAHR